MRRTNKRTTHLKESRIEICLEHNFYMCLEPSGDTLVTVSLKNGEGLYIPYSVYLAM